MKTARSILLCRSRIAHQRTECKYIVQKIYQNPYGSLCATFSTAPCQNSLPQCEKVSDYEADTFECTLNRVIEMQKLGKNYQNDLGLDEMDSAIHGIASSSIIQNVEYDGFVENGDDKPYSESVFNSSRKRCRICGRFDRKCDLCSDGIAVTAFVEQRNSKRNR